jgi:hypothetical protein
MTTRAFFFWPVFFAFAMVLSSAFGQTNVGPEILQPGGLHNLTPLTPILRAAFWLVALLLLAIAVVLSVLRSRVSPSLYRTAADTHWQEDAHEEVGETFDESEVVEACADFGKPTGAGDEVQASVPESGAGNHPRLYTPASGPVWNESMLNAFLCSCLKVSCLGRAWQAEAARRASGQQSSARLPDPREAEFIRRLKARWHEFQVDPDEGVFVEHVTGDSGSSRVCLVKVTREKHSVARATLNAGFVIDSLGRYLKSSDQVYPSGPGHYHAPNPQELTALSAEEKKCLIRLKDIPDPWQAMIAGEADRSAGLG